MRLLCYPSEGLCKRGCGGIGRHARLRGVWLTPCEFESRHPHGFVSPLIGVKIEIAGYHRGKIKFCKLPTLAF